MWYTNCTLMTPEQLTSVPRLDWTGNGAKVQRRGYVRSYSTYIHSIDGLNRVWFGIVVERGKDETAFELVRAASQDRDKWIPIHADAFDSLFPNLSGVKNADSWETCAKFTKVKRMNNRLFFVYKNSDMKDCLGWKVTLTGLSKTLPFNFLLDYGAEIAVAEIHYPKIMGVDVAASAIDALRDFNTESPNRAGAWPNSSFADEKVEILEKIERHRKGIEDSEKELQEICDKAANAMNVLSSKYGIEIEV